MKMKIFSSPLAPATLSLLLATASAEKDGSYYANGITNPNVESEKMFWKEPYNVLQDLDQFEALYVTYHNCAWETPAAGDNDNGGGGNEDDSWYLGSVPNFKPNVAYSLYGVLKGDNDSGCNKRTFINSFHTTEGVESFTNAMYAAGTDLFQYSDGDEDGNDEDRNNNNGDPTSVCYQVDNDGSGDEEDEEQADADEDEDADADEDEQQGDEDEEDQDNNEDRNRRRRLDDNNNYYNGAKYDQSAVSYGLGCADRSSSSSSNSKKAPKFAIHTYLGDYCDANAILVTRDDLEDFNDRLEQSTCVKVYSDGDYYADDEDGGGNSDDGDSPLSLLANSRSCQVYDGTGTCPDPHGKLKYYELNLSRATGIQGMHSWWSVQRVFVAGWSMLSVGILTAIIGMGLFVKECLYPASSTTSKSSRRKKGSANKNKMTRSRSNGEGSLVSAVSKSLSIGSGGTKSTKNSKSSKSTKNSKRSSKRSSSTAAAAAVAGAAGVAVAAAAASSQDSADKSANGDNVSKQSEVESTVQGASSDDGEDGHMPSVHEGSSFAEDKSREDLSSHDGDTASSQKQDKSATDNEDSQDEEAFVDESNITSDDEGNKSDASGSPKRRKWMSRLLNSSRRSKSSSP